MKIGLPFLTQLQGSPDAETGARTDPEAGGRSLGGWMAQTIRQLVSQITTSYHAQHNDDDTHKTITASGSIAERGRSTAMGVWTSVPFSAANFSAPSGSTWTVTNGQAIAYQYALVGTTMHLSFYVESSTLATAVCPTLYLAIPANAKATRRVSAQFAYDDNGTRGTGIAQVRPASASANSGIAIELMKDMRGSSNWSVSSALSCFGEISFEIVAADTITPVSNTFVASGGTITTSGTKTIHTFTASGTFTIAQGSAVIDYLVVAGGASGGSGAGGGAGGVLAGTTVADVGSIAVTVGAGGVYPGAGAPGANGSASALGSIASATGGGGGGVAAGGLGTTAPGKNGGSGGGSGYVAPTTTDTVGTGIVGQGKNGGQGAAAGGVGCGGGGGASAVGGNETVANNGGVGGEGQASSISGSSQTYGSGGGGGSSAINPGGVGGTGAGRGGGSASPNGTAATGYGCAGGGATPGQAGGDGFQGIVIISYTTP